MYRTVAVFLVCGQWAISNALAESPSAPHWPAFRGANAAGVSDAGPLPARWDVPAGSGVKWKTPIAGLGHSCPIVWGDRLFVTTAISGMDDASLKVGLYGNIEPVQDDTVHRWVLYCLDKNSGRVVWDKSLHEGVPKVKRHTKATHANSTPATDGKHIVVMLGSEGLHCLDMDGNLLWKKDFGVLDSGYYVVQEAQWGFGSSPVIHDGTVLVQCDVQKDSFLAAFDVTTGEQKWRTARHEVPGWGSPTVAGEGSSKQVIVNGYKHIGGYDFATGNELWKLRGLGDIPVPTPVLGHGLVYITNAHGGGAPLYAVRLTAKGDITPADPAAPGEHFAWMFAKTGAYMQTPLVYGERLYTCKDNGILTCYEAQSGKKLFKERLGSGNTGFTASPVAGDGKVYFTSEEGDVYVVKDGPQYELVATNPLGEICMATPAISEGTLFFRTQGHVVAIGGGEKQADTDGK